VWREAQSLGDLPDFDAEAEPGARFDAPPDRVLDEKTFGGFGKQLTGFCYRRFPLELWRSAEPKGRSRPGESQGAFLGRLQQLQREARDAGLERLRRRYAPKLARLAERIRKAEARVEREEEQYRQSRLQSAVSIGATLMGALFGRKLGSVGNVGRASSAAKSVGRSRRERGDISRAEQDLEATRDELAALEEEFEGRLEEVRLEKAVDRIECEAFVVRPRKSDTSVVELWLVWEPWSFRHGEPLASLARLPQERNNG
jgi:phage host-nuclease inhibitor protein Gam